MILCKRIMERLNGDQAMDLRRGLGLHGFTVVGSSAYLLPVGEYGAFFFFERTVV